MYESHANPISCNLVPVKFQARLGELFCIHISNLNTYVCNMMECLFGFHIKRKKEKIVESERTQQIKYYREKKEDVRIQVDPLSSVIINIV